MVEIEIDFGSTHIDFHLRNSITIVVQFKTYTSIEVLKEIINMVEKSATLLEELQGVKP